MSGAITSIGGMLGLNKSITPNYQQFDTAQAMQTQRPGVASSAGASKMVQNPDGSWTQQFESSANDRQREALMSEILSKTGDASGGDMFYDAAAKRLNQQYDRDVAATDESLVNRGLSPGSEQYQRAMGDLRQNNADALAGLASAAWDKNLQYDQNQIANANALASGRDIGLLASMANANANDYYNDYLTQANAAESARASGAAQQGGNLLSTLLGAAGAFI